MGNAEEIELTVITAVRNAVTSAGVEALRRCVKSIAVLKIPHEHIVQDGLSADGTLKELEELRKCTPGLIVCSEKDSGIYNALNKAIKMSRGQWIYVLGADDYVLRPDELCNAVRHGEKRHADIVVSPVFDSHDGSRSSGMLRDSFFCCMPYPHQGMIMSKAVVCLLGGFDERYRIAADYELTVRALLAGKSVAEYEKAYSYYCRNGLSSTDMGTDDEYASIRSLLFGIDRAEAVDLCKRRVLPWRVWWRYCLRHEPYFCRAIRFHFVRNLANSLGAINEGGEFMPLKMFHWM